MRGGSVWDDASDGEAYDDDEEVSVDADRLNAVSKAAVALLQNRKKPVAERAAEYLLYCKRMQQELLRIPHGQRSGQKQERSSVESRLIAECREKEVNASGGVCGVSCPHGALRTTGKCSTRTGRKKKKRLRAAFHEDNYLECIQNSTQRSRDGI